MGHGCADLRVISQIASADIDAEAKLPAWKLDDRARIAASAKRQRHNIAYGNFAGDLAGYGNDVAAVFTRIEDVVLGDGVDGDFQNRRLRIEHEADGRGSRNVASHVGLADGNGVAAFDWGKRRRPSLATVGAVFDSCAGFDAVEHQRAIVSYAVAVIVAAVDCQGYGWGGGCGGVDKNTGKGPVFFNGSERCRGQAVRRKSDRRLNLFAGFIQNDRRMAATGTAGASACPGAGSGCFEVSGRVEAVCDGLFQI